MIRTIIIDDEQHCIDSLAFDLQKHCRDIELLETCTNPKEGLLAIKKQKPELVFLDVQMPWMNGFEMLEVLGEINLPVIFTTAHDEFAAKAFRISAVDYLLKPISFERFLKAVNKVMDASLNGTLNIENEQQNKVATDNSIYFRSDRKMIKVNLADILYIESIKDYIKVVGVSGTVITKQSISSVEEDLPKEMFIRIHRSYIVALKKIESYSNELVWLGKAELPISRMYRHEVEKILRQK